MSTGAATVDELGRRRRAKEAQAATLDALARGLREDYDAWLAHVGGAAGCTHPIRLAGTLTHVEQATGRITREAHTTAMPDAVLYTPCGNRRGTVCPGCAETYRADTYQTVTAGLAGGKGVPASVASHPCVFLTCTAPSFGPVHTSRTDAKGRALPCHPRRSADTCQDGVDLVCWERHDEHDEIVGRPLCLDCYDHDHQAAWNLHSGELWRRTMVGAARALTRLEKLHGLTDTHAARPAGWSIAWGEQCDPRPVRLTVRDIDDRGEITTGAVAGYLAKYATKATELAGHVSTRLRPDTVAEYTDPTTHVGRQIEACWRLGERPDDGTTDPDGWREGWGRLRRWAHMLGFGGHFSTRSRRYSTTLTALRNARRDWHRQHATAGPEHDASDELADEDTTEVVVASLAFAGIGWHTSADALLANTAAANARARRQTARDELSSITG